MENVRSKDRSLRFKVWDLGLSRASSAAWRHATKERVVDPNDGFGSLRSHLLRWVRL